MKLSRMHGFAALAVVAVLLAAPVSAQVVTCALTTVCGGPPACKGCAASTPVYNAQWAPCAVPTNGGWDLTGTQYANKCGITGTATCALADVPPVRFWIFDKYSGANSGCQKRDDPAASWMGNYGVDDAKGAPGHWYLYQANWAGPAVDGCPGGIAPPPPTFRTVADITFPDQPSEGTIGHHAWYAIGAVDQAGSDYNFDRITGGNGSCAPEIKAQRVGDLTIQGRAQACTGNATGTPGGTNANAAFMNATVNLTTPTPDWFTEGGHNMNNPALISGYQIVYATGAEPTTSDWKSGVWQPTLDPTDPTKGAAVVPVGTASATIALPKTSGTNFWLATRIVYADASENPTGIFPLGAPPNGGPLVTSHVSGHCGPVVAGGIVLSVEFASVTAERTSSGVVVRWMTISEDDTNYFKVFRSTDPQGTESLTEAVSFVDAQGAFKEYAATDTSVTANRSTTYYYYVQEMTGSGPGTRSQTIKVEGANAAPGAIVSPGSSTGSRRRH